MTSTLKWLAVSIVGIFLGFGLCGLDRLVHSPTAGFNGDVLPFVGFLFCLLSVLSLLASLITLLIKFIFQVFRDNQ